MDKVLFLIKPDAINCRQEIAIRNFMMDKKIKLDHEKRLILNELQAKILCRPYIKQPYFNDLIDLLVSGASVAYVVEGDDLIKTLNRLIGDFEPMKAEEGTLRKVFINGPYLFEGFNPIYNSVMFSENLENAKREINIIYKKEEEREKVKVKVKEKEKGG